MKLHEEQGSRRLCVSQYDHAEATGSEAAKSNEELDWKITLTPVTRSSSVSSVVKCFGLISVVNVNQW